eukprot:Unigene16367_Nuclearia_a/m.48505 Unigene16367_Nuclearia_a/g.48505  ORF Unigene16367_Nuclearia_a/g.48505 Unigene16367_Nuclearia_a/m.48505 type:complete len:352 (-) Unigene16367_Nuclearia_a:159-1214(-)
MPQRLRRRLGSFSPGPDARFISIDGFQVHFEHHRPTAPAGGGVHLAPFLCLHGFGGSTYTWRNLVPRFCDLGAHVYCLDRLGFGLSRGAAVGTKDAFRNQRRVMPYSHQYAADAVLKFMDRLGLARVLLVGHSIGCLTAMMVALGHPERVAGLVLFAPAVFIGGAPFGLRRVLNTPLMNTIMPVTAKFMMERFTDAMVNTTFYNKSVVTPDVVDGYADRLVPNWQQLYWAACKAVINAPVSLTREELARVHASVLIVGGNQDNVVPPRHYLRLLRALPHATLRLFDQNAHMPQEETPQLCMAVLVPWLRRHVKQLCVPGPPPDEPPDVVEFTGHVHALAALNRSRSAAPRC